jgi:uncharacterized protein
MKRDRLNYLKRWKERCNRKPLVIRGARQVGKSYLVRMFCKENDMDLFEVNLEMMDGFRECFKSNDVSLVISLLELKADKEIIEGKTVLFLDEIQAAPEVLALLRYFYELKPNLHIIAAGSLLEFILEEHSFSMPVGRIEYMYLGPMSYKEFLTGIGKVKLVKYMSEYELDHELPIVIHNELYKQYKLYLLIGGMPEAIQTYINTGSLLDVDAVKQSILSTYRDDFNKYDRRINNINLQKVFQKLPAQVGQKLKYVNIDRDVKSTDIKKILHMLELARVFYPVKHTAANGIPLRAEANDKFQKALFLDVGLFNKACGVSYLEIESCEDINYIHSGAISEQFIGQHLLYRSEPFDEPELYYWCREKAQSSAEVDYVINLGSRLIPVEVKSGKTGTLKSLNVFLNEKKLNFAVRFNADIPSLADVNFSMAGLEGSYRLLSLPHYMVEELGRLLVRNL